MVTWRSLNDIDPGKFDGLFKAEFQTRVSQKLLFASVFLIRHPVPRGGGDPRSQQADVPLPYGRELQRCVCGTRTHCAVRTPGYPACRCAATARECYLRAGASPWPNRCGALFVLSPLWFLVCDRNCCWRVCRLPMAQSSAGTHARHTVFLHLRLRRLPSLKAYFGGHSREEVPNLPLPRSGAPSQPSRE
jgi:hypothetical protein